MAKLFQTISIVVVFTVALCSATPAILDNIRTTRNRFLARQEVAEDIPAQTPYPPSGVRPEVPFTLPTEQKLVAPANHYLPPLTDPAMFYSAPAEVYGPPAETYGPPEINSDVENGKSVPEVSEDQPEEETQTEAVQSDQSEETDEVQVTDEEQQENVEGETEEEVTAAEEQNSLPERLVLAKRTGPKAAKLRQQTPLAQKADTAQRFYLINGSLYVLA